VAHVATREFPFPRSGSSDVSVLDSEKGAHGRELPMLRHTQERE